MWHEQSAAPTPFPAGRNHDRHLPTLLPLLTLHLPPGSPARSPSTRYAPGLPIRIWEKRENMDESGGERGAVQFLRRLYENCWSIEY
jgi:hypothetical protein